MNKGEIKKIMAIARPAVWAAYGRQPLRLTAYNIMSDTTTWIELEGDYNHVEEKFQMFKLRLESGKVTYLNIGELG